MSKRIVTAALLAGAATLALGSFAGQAWAEKKVLNYGMATKDVGRLDPHMTATTPDKALLQMIFSGLVRFKPGTISPELIEPDLAEKWTSSADGKEWTFNLRKGVKCHDGNEFTSADVVYSLKRAADSKTSQFASDYKDFDKVEAPDASTVKVTLKNPIPSLLGMVANLHGGNMVCMKAAEAAGENFKLKPIGTGPFVFKEYKPQQSVTLVANPDYFRGRPKLDTIEYKFIESDASRDLAFAAGELDLIYGKQDETWVERTKKVKGAVVAVIEPGELSSIYLNIKHEILKDIRVRKAIAHAIDRKAMVQLKGASTAREAKSIVPIGYLGYAEDVPLLPYDPEKSKALLKEAGYPNGFTLKVIHTNLSGMLPTMQAWQAMLKKVGINLEIDVVEHATFHAQIRKDLSPIVHYAAARFPVADIYLTQFFHSRSIVNTPTAVTNFTHCDQADAEIDAARVEPDPAKAKALWRTAQVKLMDAVCAVPSHEQLSVFGYHDDFVLGYDLKGSLSLGPMITEQSHFK
ncbi:MAG: polyamine ABC transporter substrate-binding protein [Alphaproteobacteria bacterium]|nr:polyamine ABC transporter substrate-binding protein [Alphaproteobacteria bacterium]